MAQEMIETMPIKALEDSTENVIAHQVALNMIKAPSEEINPGVFITIKVRVTCPMNCNFKADKVQIIDHEGQVVKEINLIILSGMAFETDPIVIKAPTLPGIYTWKAYYPEQDKEDVTHLEASVLFTFTVKKLHVTSMAVWDVVSPVVAKDSMKFKVGVKCSADCQLTDQWIRIYDQDNIKVATAQLGDKPWEDTGGLYWAEVELPAPAEEGFYNWQVKFLEPCLEIPHKETETSFSFRVVNPPECTINVEVLDRADKSPIQGASIILNPYRGLTNELGKARLEVTKGEYMLNVAGLSSYESYQTKITINEDICVQVELEGLTYIGD